MDALALVLSKKYDIYVCHENTIKLNGCRRIPLNIHSRIPDYGELSRVVNRFGYVLISENDASDNLVLFVQSKTRSTAFRQMLYIVLNSTMLFLAIYFALAKLKDTLHA